ncbi:MAG: nuclear transport factor 2 family protein [Pseudomonadota bacterium]
MLLPGTLTGFLVVCALGLAACGREDASVHSAADPDLIQSIERERLRALVEADIETANRIHAVEFELVSPSGRIYSRDQYLGGIESGDLDYLVFQPESEIKVRMGGSAAVVRYQSTIEIRVDDQYFAPERFWHTDTYELRDGQWQVVWSQATAIAAE